MQLSAEELLRRELAPGERLRWSGGPRPSSRWLDPGWWGIRLFKFGVFGAFQFGAYHRAITDERSVAPLLVPPILGVAGGAVLAGAWVLLGRPSEIDCWESHRRRFQRLTIGGFGAMVMLTTVWSIAHELAVISSIVMLVLSILGTATLAKLFLPPWANSITAFGLTDQHALVLRREAFRANVERLPLASMTKVEFKERRDGRGMIRFPEFTTRPCGEGDMCAEAFFDVDHARHVFELVEAARTTAQRGPSGFGFDGEDDEDAVWRIRR